MKVKKYSVKPAALAIVACIALISLSAVAQEARSEIGVQGTGLFTKDSNGNGIQNKATERGGLLIGCRYNVTRWLAAEANYGYDRNPQGYIGSTSNRVQSNIHPITGSAVVKLPGFARMPYTLSGGGELIFGPTANAKAPLLAHLGGERRFPLWRRRRLRLHATPFAARRISRLRVQITELQPGQPQAKRADAYCAGISVSVPAELGAESKDSSDWTTAASHIGLEGNSANNPKTPPLY
jgi:hypothetical protein